MLCLGSRQAPRHKQTPNPPATSSKKSSSPASAKSRDVAGRQARRHQLHRLHFRRRRRQAAGQQSRRSHRANSRRADLAHERRRPADHPARPGPELHARHCSTACRSPSRPKAASIRQRAIASSISTCCRQISSLLEWPRSPQPSLVEGGLAGHGESAHATPVRLRRTRRSATSSKGAYQSSSEEVDPRASFLISKNWDDKFGVLLNVAASKRTFRTDGWSSQGWTSGRVGRRCESDGRRDDHAGHAESDCRLQRGFDWNLPSLLPNNATTRADGFVNESGLTQRSSLRTRSCRASAGRRCRSATAIASAHRSRCNSAPTENARLHFDALYAELESDFDRYTNNLLVRNTNAGTNNADRLRLHHAAQLRARRQQHAHERHALERQVLVREPLTDNETGLPAASRSAATGRPPTTSRWTSKHPRAESDLRCRMTTYLFLSDPGSVGIAVNGTAFPTITPELDLADVRNWQFDTVRVQPRTRDEENENRRARSSPSATSRRNVKWARCSTSSRASASPTASSVGVTQGSCD